MTLTKEAARRALMSLDQATTPANAGKLTRLDYAIIEESLRVLGLVVDAMPEPDQVTSSGPTQMTAPEPAPANA